eukprot:Sdes_comp13110_c0_seq1m3054
MSASQGTNKVHLPKVAKVKNKMPAAIQITAEQILRGAMEGQIAQEKAPESKITSAEELQEYRLRKRKDFEDIIRRNRLVVSNWLRYAKWEEGQSEFERARSIYERALDVNHRNVQVWLKYVEMEMKNGNVNHARNIFDRAVLILPRADQFWYKYVYMEETLGNIAGARQVFERWMEWEPEIQAWQSFIKMELRYGETERARDIYERFVLVHHDCKNWIKYARFEEESGSKEKARQVYERAMEFFGQQHMQDQLLVAFSRFEESCKEFERAEAILKLGMEILPKEKSENVSKQLVIFKKKHGVKEDIEKVVFEKRKAKYEQDILENSNNYDTWFDYLRLMETNASVEETREVYERAIANVPPSQEKRFWRRYIYLWIFYALFEEVDVKDMDRTRGVYKACLQLIPHESFTFAKIWLLYAQFEIRQLDVGSARKALGTALGKCPKDKLFKGYIELEIELREFDRVRTLYEKYIFFNPCNSKTWCKYAELEFNLNDIDRARSIYELSVSQNRIDMPEVLWKAYIDFEVAGKRWDQARILYERLLEKTQHVKVWISYAEFEAKSAEYSLTGLQVARKVYRKADESLRKLEQNENRALLMDAWKKFEDIYGTAESRKELADKMPRKVKRRRQVVNEEGHEAGWEEYYDYIFPDEASEAPNMKLLQMAHLWKQKQATMDKN